MTFWQKLAFTAPIYVTRPDADGNVGYYEVNIWLTMGAMFIVYLNVILWGIYGIYLFHKVVF